MNMHSVSSGTPSEQGLTSDEALARLRAGNERFVRGEARFPTIQKDILAELAKGQQPYATILGCSDSRVPPELVFDAGFGELFIVRVAGNVVSPEVMGTLQYAGVHLRTPLFVVLGHEGCGAVQAALAAKFRGKRDPKGNRAAARRTSRPAWTASTRTGLRTRNCRQASRRTCAGRCINCSRRRRRRTRKAEGLMKLVGAVYELATGRVRFLD